MRTGAKAWKRGAWVATEEGRLRPMKSSVSFGEGVRSWVRRIEEMGQRYFRRGKGDVPGKDGGKDAGDLLDGLPPGFFVIRDFDSGRGRIDHLLIGPKGIFVLSVQHHDGIITVLGDQIFRNGRPLDKDLIRQIRDESRMLQELLARRGITELKPLCVIVFTNAVVGLHGTSRGVEVLPKDSLPAFMKRRKDVISPRDAEGIFEFLKIGQASCLI